MNCLHISESESTECVIARSQGLVKSHCGIVDVSQAYQQEENCKRNFHKNVLTNLETKVLTDSPGIDGLSDGLDNPCSHAFRIKLVFHANRTHCAHDDSYYS